MTSPGVLVATLLWMLLLLLLEGTHVQRAVLTLQVSLTQKDPRWRHDPGVKPHTSHALLLLLLNLLLVVVCLFLTLRVAPLVEGEAAVVLLLQ